MAAVPPRQRRRFPVRILTAVPLCDGHDSAIMTINQELVRHGAEVIYLGYHQSASAIARAAVQEDVDAIGISSYNGGHVVFFREVLAQLRRRGAGPIRVFGGGGGTFTAGDERILRRDGVERIFFAGTPLDEIVATLLNSDRPANRDTRSRGDLALSRAITLAERRAGSPDPAATRGRNRSIAKAPMHSRLRSAGSGRSSAVLAKEGAPALLRSRTSGGPFVLGIAGPGGAGKSTLIDELVSRFLRDRTSGRLAILANDPSHANSGGALLGDRVSAIYAQHDRVFFRSLATRGSSSGLSAIAPAAIATVRDSGEFSLVFVESVGIGQDSDPFGTMRGNPLVDAVLFVIPPHYGGRVQLDKIALLDGADLVALNKCDDPRAATAKAELAARLRRNAGVTPLHFTIAAQHDDRGVNELYATLAELAALDASGGERACQLRIHG